MKQIQGFYPGTALKFILLCLFIFQSTFSLAFAQEVEVLKVQAPDVSLFPEISVSFKLPTLKHDLTSILQLEHLKVIENKELLQPVSLNRERIGVNFTLVVNPGRSLDLRDSNGISPYEKLKDALVLWAQSRSTLGGDRWSLIGDSGLEVSNANDQSSWIDAFKSYQPDFRMLEPQTSSLENAINLTEERVVTFGVDKSILYITPAPIPAQIEVIKNLTNRARSAGIQVNVWMVDDAYYLTNDQGGVLFDLAEKTGGQFFNFWGTDEIPDPETYMRDLGYYFTLAYQSEIRETGTFPLKINLAVDEVEIYGESSSFYIEVKPPNPILISPPPEIRLVQKENQPDVFSQSNQAIEFMVEFPDCHNRAITTTRLYVDGRIVDEQNEPPFNILNWDLTAIKETGQHDVQVEVLDNLGFSGKTILTPVQIEIIIPEFEERSFSSDTGLILLVSLLAICLIFLAAWNIRRFLRSKRFWSVIKNKEQNEKKFGAGASRILEKKSQISAKLIPLICQPGAQDSVIEISKTRTHIGSDPIQADLILDDPDVAGLQAVMFNDEGGFWINDLGSKNGTWVNYVKIGRQPIRIFTGDILSFGMCGFRFSLMTDISDPKVTISKYEPIL